MTNKAWGYEYRSTTVCIDSYENGSLTGRLYNPYLDTGQAFENLTQFLLQMEQLLDTMSFPQSATVTRTFAETPKAWRPQTEPEFRKGQTATFAVKVLFRQNASWQGSVIWQEGGREQSFRSVLELIFLLDSALNRAKETAC